MQILVTGASGYIGSHLISMLSVKSNNHHKVVGCFRMESQAEKYSEKLSIKVVVVGDIDKFNRWEEILSGIDVVVHLAAKAHMMSDDYSMLDRFRVVNRDATLKLAQAAVNTGVKRFIYISSIGVLGDSTYGAMFRNSSEYNPQEPYAISKMESEIGLKKITESSNIDVVIVRPPLVYGPNAPGNFNRLLKLVRWGVPLPLSVMKAKKSMISLDNLCDLLMKTMTAPLPKFSKLVVSDGSNWSTAELVVLIANHMNNKNQLFTLPKWMLNIVAFIIGKKREIYKLSVPLQVDGSETAELLNWSPIQTPEDAIKVAIEQE